MAKTSGPVCGAKTRQGGTCQQPAMENGRCRYHGGLSPSGVSHYRYKTGRYSKYLPDRIAGKYLESQEDPELLNLRDEIALTDARIAELLGRVDGVGGEDAISEINRHYQALRAAMRAADNEGIAASLVDLETAITTGRGDYEIWREIGTVIEQRRRLVESEGKRLVAMSQMISNERAMLLIGSLVAILRDHVKDTQVLNDISLDIRKLIASETG